MDWRLLEFWRPFIACWNDYRWLTVLTAILSLAMAVGCYLLLCHREIHSQRYAQNYNVYRESRPLRPTSHTYDNRSGEETANHNTNNPDAHVLSTLHKRLLRTQQVVKSIIRRLSTKCKENR